MPEDNRRLYRFEAFELDPVRHMLSRGGERIEVRPKTFELLRLLAENAGRLMSKDEIMRAVWPDVVVTDDSLVQCVHELRQALSDAEQRLIRTVPRRGYLLDVLVSIEKPASADPQRKSPKWLIAAALSVAILAAGYSILRPSPHAIPARQLSIAVLPFAVSSEAGQDLSIGDALAEGLLTNLGKFPDLWIVARKSTAAFKGDLVGAKQIGEELGVRFLLDGSVRREDEHWKVTVQLIDTHSEQQIWANRYSLPFRNSSGPRDAIVQEIASTAVSWASLSENLHIADRAPENLSSHELVLRARGVLFRAESRSTTMEARRLVERATVIDPNFAAAYVELGRTYYRAFALQWEGPEALDRALSAAQRAILLDQSLPSAHELLGRIYLRRRQHDAAIATLEKTIGLNPARAETYASLADALTFAGRPSEAVPMLEKAIRLDPLYPPRFDMYLGRAQYFDRNYRQAVLALERCTARAPEFRPCYMYLVPVYAELDRISDARKAIDKLKQLAPNFSIDSSVRTHLPFVDSAMVQYIASLKKAGAADN